MIITRELIERFFQQECNAAEREAVSRYFQDHPEELNKYMDKQGWDHFDYQERLHPEVSKKLLSGIQRSTYKKYVFSKSAKQMIAAASVVLVLATGWWYLNRFEKRNGKPTIAENKRNEASSIIQRRINTTAKILSITLPDSSKAELLPGSILEFYEPFTKDGQRVVYLQGKSFFEVAKDKTKPFTVYSDGIGTTAIGTSFTISALKNDHFISVHLHTGKVVVKSADPIHRKLSGNIYLTPGNILVYDKSKMLAVVSKEKNKEVAANAKIPNWYMFNNQPLGQVFQQLEELYGVQIKYAESDVKNMYFIGRFEKTDSLDHIIRDLALLNKLLVKKQGNTYILTKK